MTASLLILGAVTILNLNGLMDMRFDVRNILSPFILLLSAMLIVFVPAQVKKDLWSGLKFYYLFMLFYVLLGFSVAFSNGVDIDPLYVLVRSHVSSIIVVSAAAFGFTYYAKVVNRTTPLDYVYALAVLSLASIFYGRFDPSIYQYAHYGDLYQSRFSGFFGNPNEAGTAACVTATFCLFYMAKGSRPLPHVGLLALSGVGVFLTFSRAAILTYVVLVFVYILSLLISRRKKVLGIVTVLIGGLILAGVSDVVLDTDNWNPIQQQRITNLMEIARSDDGAVSKDLRFELLGIGGSMIEEAPIVGHGLGALHKMEKAGGLGVHNSFLVIQGEVGILGSLLFILFLVYIFRKAFRLKDVVLRRFVLAYLFVFLSMMFFDHNGLTLRNHNYYLGVVIAIVCLAGNRGKHQDAFG